MAVKLTDTFTVGTDAELSAYGDYTKLMGSDMEANATNDRAEPNTSNSGDDIYMWDGSGSPTGDQQVECDCAGDGVAAAAVVVRAGETDDAYELYYWPSGTPADLWKITAGGWAVMDTGTNCSASGSMKLKATGTGTVTLEGWIDGEGASSIDATDSTSQHDSGYPGLGEYIDSGGEVPWLDNFVVDDLVAGGETYQDVGADIADASDVGAIYRHVPYPPEGNIKIIRPGG